MTTAETIVAVDVGNSAIKVAIAKAGTTAKTAGAVHDNHRPVGDGLLQQSFPLDSARCSGQLCAWVAEHAGDTPLSWWVSTVNRAASGPLQHAVTEQFASSNQVSQWRILGHEDVPLQTDVDFPECLGIDRLVGAYAASIRYATPLVVVDAGSAVTVDWIRSDRGGRAVFAGGAILPGIRLQHAALATGTEGLRQQIEFPKQPACPTEFRSDLEPATSTEQAIRLGVIAAVAGGIERLAEAYFSLAKSPTENSSENPLVVLTGGDGPTISAYLRSNHALAPNLVCLGLLDLANRQCQNAASGLK